MIASVSWPDCLARWSRPCTQGGRIGAPYQPDGCWLLVRELFEEAGHPLPADVYQAGRHFRPLRAGERPQALDLAYFVVSPLGRRHVGVMLDARWMLQSSRMSNGVSREELSRDPWAATLRGLYRLKDTR